MRSTLTRGLVIATVVVAGLASPLDRVVVGIPAWQHLGADAWAAYSRNADLGAGLIVYPITGIGLAVLAVAAAISYRADRDAPPAARLLIYLAAIGAIGVMATTAIAAPIMLSVPTSGIRPRSPTRSTGSRSGVCRFAAHSGRWSFWPASGHLPFFRGPRRE